MSVKFEKETVTTAPFPGARQQDVANTIGKGLMGGKQAGGKAQTGYLAVRYPSCCPNDVSNNANSHTFRHTSSSCKHTLSELR